MTSKKSALNEVTERVGHLARGYKPCPENLYNSDLEHLARIPVPALRSLHREGFSFSHLSHVTQASLWTYVLKKTSYFEVASQALMYFEARRGCLAREDWATLQSWVNYIDNWAHSDTLSSIYAQLHEQFPTLLYPTFTQWNQSTNPWKRRQSVVSLFYYASARKTRQPSRSKVVPLVRNLLEDDHYYVQKGVGWTLRELYNVYPEEALTFLRRYLDRIHPHAWQAASEKLPRRLRSELVSQRKDMRGKR